MFQNKEHETTYNNMRYDNYNKTMSMTDDEVWSWYNKLPRNEREQFESSMKKRNAFPPDGHHLRTLKVIQDELESIVQILEVK